MKQPEQLTQRSINRRQFAKTSAAWLGTAGLASLLGPGATQGAEDHAHHDSPYRMIAPNDVILFQGDSITDAGRKRDQADQPNLQPGLGNGYAWLAAVQLLLDRPQDNLKIFNRGISGHKVFQLANRWQTDCLDLKPNLLSILIGVNDIWHKLGGRYDGTVEDYETGFRALLQRTLKEIPGVRIVICEPFVLRCGAVNDAWFPEFDQRRAAARRLADELSLTLVPFQSMFDAATKDAAPEYWAGDGVHPTLAGHALMAKTWREVVGI